MPLSEYGKGGWRPARAVWLAYSSPLSFYLGRLAATLSRPGSHGVHSPETCGINKDNAVWNNNSQFYPIEERDNRRKCGRIQKKPRWKAERQACAPLWLSCGEWWNLYQHALTPTALRDPMPILTFGCHDAEMQFVLLSAKITEGEHWLVFPFILTHFFHSLPSFSFFLFPIAFSECNLVWRAGGLFWISQCFWLPPRACGAFSQSQSCRPGLERWKRIGGWGWGGSSKKLGVGHLHVLQSEPCRAQIERVILLLKLWDAPQMAFVLLGDGVKAIEDFRPGESLCSAGNTQNEKAKCCGPSFTSALNSGPKPNRWSKGKTTTTTTTTHTHTRSEIKTSEHPPMLRLNEAFHHQTNTGRKCAVSAFPVHVFSVSS